MKATITLDSAGIAEALKAWGERRGMKVRGHRLNIETGDPGDPRESGFRRESIVLDVELTALDLITADNVTSIVGAL